MITEPLTTRSGTGTVATVHIRTLHFMETPGSPCNSSVKMVSERIRENIRGAGVIMRQTISGPRQPSLETVIVSFVCSAARSSTLVFVNASYG